MPDVTVMEENGFTPHYFLNPVPDFDGSVISTLTTAAVLEPTFIGEIVLGGVVLTIFLYEWSQVLDAKFPNEACLDFFEECQRWNSLYYTNMDCSSCLKVCYDTKIGRWPYNLCPIGF